MTYIWYFLEKKSFYFILFRSAANQLTMLQAESLKIQKILTEYLDQSRSIVIGTC